MAFTVRPALIVTASILTASSLAAGVVAVANAAQPDQKTSATFVKSSKWDTGFVGEYTIRNGSAASPTWELSFDLPPNATLGSYWNALVTQAGKRVVAKNREYNGNLKPGATASFGFLVNGTGEPANCKINGAPCGGGNTGPQPPQPSPSVSPTASPQPPKPPTASPKPPTESPTPPKPEPPTPVPPGDGKTVFGPYIHMSVTGRPTLAEIAKNTGAKAIHLAFVLNANGTCDLKWDGVSDLGIYKAEIDELKAAGVLPIVSTGGANGTEAAVGCRTKEATAAQLERVIALGVKYIDFDVEGVSVSDTQANVARGQAIQQLQAKYPDLRVSMTLASLPPDRNGTPGGVIEKDQAPWKAAVAAGAKLNRINIMTMNFGTFFDEGKGTTIMGEKSIAAAQDLQKQIKQIHKVGDAAAWKMVGITPMIGVNDTTTEVFQLEDAKQVADFAKANGVGLVSYWSVSRDVACNGNVAQPSPVCSGVGQQRYEFGKRFAAAQ
jgi:hypothetical protein